MKIILKPDSRVPDGWLPRNEVLTVLAINNDSTGTKFLLWSKQQECAALFPATDFEIVDGGLSRSWIASMDLTGYIFLAPPEWQLDFWDRYNEGEPTAAEEFYKVMTKIEGE